MIVGDFNLPNLRWKEDYSCEAHCSDTSPLMFFHETFTDLRLSQLIDFSTFNQANGTSTNTLDLIFADVPTGLTNFHSYPPLGSSFQGHLVISWTHKFKSTNLTSRAKKRSTTLLCKKGDYDKFNTMIGKIDWNKTLSSFSLDSCYDSFLRVYDSTCLGCIPKLKITLDTKKYTNQPG